MTDMNDNAAQKLNEAMAAMLADLNSQRILDCARKARLFSDLLAFERHESRPLVDGLAGDLGRLYKSVLVFERDPEVLRRNTLAMVLMSLSPLTVGIQDLLSSPDFPLWKVGMEGLVLGLEVMGTTQYLESAKLIAGTEYECNLWELEGRSMELLAGRSDAARLPAQQQSISEFFDSLRGDKYRHEQRPAVYLILCLVLSIISYSMVRKAFKV
jgi:hypothetical protein